MDYIKTDVGLITKENANWIYSQNLIDETGRLRSVPLTGLSQKGVQLFSYLRWVIEDVKQGVTTPPSQIKLGTDEAITLMREGSIAIPYTTRDGEEYTYRATYPQVDNIQTAGKRLYSERNNTGTKGIDFSDL